MYTDLARNMDYVSIKNAAELALKCSNLTAIKGLSRVNKVAVADALSSPDAALLVARRISYGEVQSPVEIYLLLRGNLNPKYKRIFKRLAKMAILKSSLRISGRGLKGPLRKKVPYYPGLMEFDEEATIDFLLEKGYVSYEDIVGLERRSQAKSGVLIFDSSGSMTEEKLFNAALSTAVLAYHMRSENYAVIGFSTRAFILKAMNERKDIGRVVEEILDIKALGYSNMSDGLSKGLKELSKVKRSGKRWGILITDGEWNVGGDPTLVAAKFPLLHVIATPSKGKIAKYGLEACKKIAKAGKGRFVVVKKFSEIPRLLIRLLLS
ncbi:MAG: vWA domain-containing protein [Candidatus Freyarchaeota archaeon]|nr:VWA domain-containing protein [Candidatus Freyrarchaeum guaymaensis]HDO80479.1 VWA domain-containing protein [Candidatus Bathyarchaeota archaeon]